MMKNVGNIDRIVRFAAAVLLIAAGFFSGGNLRYGLWIFSLLPLTTGYFRFCPLWVPFKINTNKS